MGDHSKCDERRRQLAVLVGISQPESKQPPRRARSTPGPVPTLASTAETFAWCWAQCALPCCHYAAIPLDRAAVRLGPDATTDDLYARLACTVCGRRKATLRMASWSDIKIGGTPLPREKIAAGFAQACGDVC